MAKLRLGRREAISGSLPALCLKCGAPATASCTQTFSCRPSWAIFTILLGLVPFVVISLVTTQRLTMEVPMCFQHQRHWSSRKAFLYGGLLGFIGLIAAVCVAKANGVDLPLTPPVIAVGCVAAFVFLVTAMLQQSSAIRASEIVPRGITLIHVSPDFVAQVRAERQARRDAIDDDQPVTDD